MLLSRESIITIGSFATAAVLALGAALGSVTLIERQTRAEIEARLAADGIAWAAVRADGLLVSIGGQSPSEAQRFRALTLAGQVVDGARILDEIAVTPSREIAPPPFLMEILRNRQNVSVVGLVPLGYDPELILDRIAALDEAMTVSEMVETADFPVPEGWARAVGFAIDAMRMLPVSKVSVAPDVVTVTGLATDARARRDVETRLRQNRPTGLEIDLQISVPRPVITPFTLRFTIEDGTPRFDACSADTVEAREEIFAAARAAGMSGTIICTLGMGTPSPRWAQAARLAIDALARLGEGAITLSDTDISLVVPYQVAQAEFDRAVGQLEANLPDVFSLQAVRQDPPADAASTDEPVEFVATLTPDGVVRMQGRLTDERIRDAVHAYARARFGWNNVEMAARLDDSLPEGWPLQSLTAIEALAELHEGTASVRPDRIALRGVSGSPDASDVVSRILSDKLGQGADFRVNVRYDERLDPAAQIPTPDRCEGWIQDILAERKITFAPGSARIDSGAQVTLDRIGDVLRTCGALEMTIGGHTDSQGSADGNLALSQRRAEAVLDALMARQVLVSGLVATGFGASQPIADNATPAGREANRRIEFRLLGRRAAEPPAAFARDPELEAQLEIRVTEGAGTTPRPRARPVRN